VDELLANDTASPDEREKMDIVFVGHVDHGKSTVIGRLLADTDVLPEGKFEQIQESCERNSKPFEYAYLIDALKDERAQNITIDSARVFFQSEKRHYIIIDAPGHIEFIKNMVTGASRAEAAVLVIDANEGIQENSRRHGYLLWMLGIQQIVVAVNKMDLVGYRQEVYDAICAEYNTFLREIGVRPLCYIPVSGRQGDNIAKLSGNMPWYDGQTVLGALDSFTKAKPLTDKPFRLPIQDIYRFTMYGDDRRIVAGTASSGSVRVGDELVFYPSGKRSTIKTMETFSAPVKEKAASGDSLGLTLETQIYIRRGQIAARSDEPAPKVASRIRVSLFWLGKHPMLPKKQYILKLGTAKVKAQIETIHRIIDASDYAHNQAKNVIEHHDVAECTLSLSHPIAFDLSSSLTDISRFVIVDDYEIWGGGIVLEDITDANAQLLEEVVTRDM
jgi:bifunctional enzyme CysN/CysC